MNPSPKEFYRVNHKEESGKLNLLVNEAWFQRAIVAATAELATRGASSEQIEGAKKFVTVLHSLSEDEQPITQFPDHSDPSEPST